MSCECRCIESRPEGYVRLWGSFTPCTELTEWVVEAKEAKLGMGCGVLDNGQEHHESSREKT